ncbi:hypothetical protein EI94DRAFT_1834423 [Lactarius quietus]|nr:hypothetical protein EI94DRAFT_1834423 [Lactarius quietus]
MYYCIPPRSYVLRMAGAAARRGPNHVRTLSTANMRADPTRPTTDQGEGPRSKIMGIDREKLYIGGGLVAIGAIWYYYATVENARIERSRPTYSPSKPARHSLPLSYAMAPGIFRLRTACCTLVIPVRLAICLPLLICTLDAYNPPAALRPQGALPPFPNSGHELPASGDGRTVPVYIALLPTPPPTQTSRVLTLAFIITAASLSVLGILALWWSGDPAGDADDATLVECEPGPAAPRLALAGHRDAPPPWRARDDRDGTGHRRACRHQARLVHRDRSAGMAPGVSQPTISL